MKHIHLSCRMKQILILFCAIVATIVAVKPVPNYIKPCKRSDPNLNECFAKSANLAMNFIAQGDKEYDIHTLKPMNWRELLIVDMPPLKLMLLEIQVYGADNMTVVDPMIDLEAQLIQFTFTNPQIIWRSKFVVVVQENEINMQTDGHATIYFRNGKYRMFYEYDLFTHDGLEFANITKFNSDFLTVDLDFKLDHLDSNPIIEREWEKVRKNFINEQVTVACGEIVGSYINKILNVVPFKNIFTK